MLIFFFQILVLQKYWVLAESRIPLKPVLGRITSVGILTFVSRINFVLILAVLCIKKFYTFNLEVSTIRKMTRENWLTDIHKKKI